MKERCCEEVREPGRWPRYHQCSREGTIERGGQWFCKQHDPVAVEAKREAKHKKWSEEWAKEREEKLRQALALKIIEDIPTDFLEKNVLLIRGSIKKIIEEGL